MQEQEAGDYLNELIRDLEAEATDIRKRRRLADLAARANESHRQLRKNVDSLQETLSHLRVCIKYQLFDLEATRRENQRLRKMLDDRNR